MSYTRYKQQHAHLLRGTISRRAFLTKVGVAAAGSLLLPSADVFARSLAKDRRITLHNMNTDEELSVVCSPQQNYDRKLLAHFNHFLRDYRTDEVHPMDPSLLDLLYAVSVLTRSRGEYKVISGYRAPETNYMLRKMGHGVAEHSLHMQGKAIDFRTDDVSTRTLRHVALALEQGGVGYYPSADFVHMDTGAVRSW
jgi:uncharacterized protein YcbK (DUF882 family)